jgi:HSP20 family molecular chaperone IbpA
MTPIEEAIGQVEHLYRSITGRQTPSNGKPYAPIPPEIDAGRHVEEQLGRLLELVRESLATPAPPPWMPPVSVHVDDKELVVQVDLAGVPRESIKVSVAGDAITVSGTRPPPWSSNTVDERLRYSERPFGPFLRSVTMPAGVAMGDLRATLTDGVLVVRASRKAEMRTEPQAVPVM